MLLFLFTLALTPVDQKVSAEIARLEKAALAVEAAKVPKDLGNMLEGNKAAVDRVKTTTDSLVRLYRLREAFIGVETLAFVLAHPGSAESLDSFRKLWDARGASFTNLARPKSGAEVATALEQAAVNRAEKLYKASLPYAKVSSPLSGVYYLGEAEANRRFAEFLRSLPKGTSASPPAAAALRAAIDQVQDKALAVFTNEPTSPAMIPVNVRLKEANELLDRGDLYGATLLLLEARFQLSRATPAPASAPASSGPSASEFHSMFEAIAAERSEVAAQIRADVIPLYRSLSRRDR